MADKQQVIKDLDKVISLIRTDSDQISAEDKKEMVADTLNYFDNYVSPGWLKYRKSVSSDSEAGAVLEWHDEGAYCYGLNGEKFIDCLGGFGIYTCGHRNPEIMDVVKAQLDHQALHSQELLDPLRGYLAKAVADITPGDLQYCFFTNGGAEAVEMSLKLARIATGGRWYISTVGAFHGKSMGAISMGGKSTYRVPYTLMVQQVQHVQYGVAEDIRKAIVNLQAVGEKVAGVILEPIQGEAGVIIPPEGYLQEVRDICDETGVALIFDEIQTGMGRTGTMWRCEAEGVVPDIMTFGKAFGGGIMPITGIICKPKMWTQELIDNPWLLGSPTFGGNPVCCSAALATIKYMLENDIPGVCKTKGEFLKAGLDKLAAKYPEVISEVRGTGLMLAVEFHTFRYYASLIKTPHGGVYEVNEGFGKMHSYTVHEPTGVCALITPWNYPLLMGVWKLAPALAAGNSIVFKPSSNCVLSSIKMFEIFEKVGLPKGCANLVLGPGGVVGNELASNMDVDMITFTGSTSVDQSIMRAAAGNVKKIGLELGGKSPNVIFADADLEGAVEWAMIGIFLNQGEICSAGSRIIIEESIKDQFVKRLAERANAITIGNPLENPDMGPLVSKSHMEKVLSYIQSGIDEGATLVCGGSRYTENGCDKGYFVRPTVFDNCTDDMTIVKEEIFGPVVTVQKFRTEQEAIDMANNTPYGLAGAVFTADGSRALRVIKEIRAGITWINCYNPCFNEAPWGGYKMSGIGRELGVHGLEEYQEIKQININLNPGIVGWYEH